MFSARRAAQWVLRIIVVSWAVLIAARSLAGPLEWLIAIHSPMNVEGVFGLAMVLLMLVRAMPALEVPEQRRRALDWLDVIALAAISVLIVGALWRAANFYFLSDDFILLKQSRSYWARTPRIFLTPGGDGFYRPLTHLSMAFTSIWAGSNPMLWHAFGILMHVLNSILVFFLACAFGLSRLPAYFAAGLFAVHATRPETVVWVAARSDLLATSLVLVALLTFIRSWDASRGKGILYRSLSLLAMVLGFLCKESSYTLPLLLVVFLASRGALRDRRAWYALVPFFATTAGFLAWRWFLFGGIGGYLNPAGQPEALTIGILPLLKTFGLRLWAVLFFPINWSNQPGSLLGMLLIANLAALWWLSESSAPRRALLLQVAFLLLLALPPLQQLLIGPDLQKSRMLYLPSAAFCLLLATATQNLKPRPRWAVMIAILTFNLAALFHNLGAWEQASREARSACSVAAACATGRSGKIAVVGLPPSVNGVYFFANGFPECVELQRNGDPGAVELKKANPPFERSQFSCVLSWNPKTGELFRVP